MLLVVMCWGIVGWSPTGTRHIFDTIAESKSVVYRSLGDIFEGAHAFPGMQWGWDITRAVVGKRTTYLFTKFALDTAETADAVYGTESHQMPGHGNIRDTLNKRRQNDRETRAVQRLRDRIAKRKVKQERESHIFVSPFGFLWSRLQQANGKVANYLFSSRVSFMRANYRRWKSTPTADRHILSEIAGWLWFLGSGIAILLITILCIYMLGHALAWCYSKVTYRDVWLHVAETDAQVVLNDDPNTGTREIDEPTQRMLTHLRSSVNEHWQVRLMQFLRRIHFPGHLIDKYERKYLSKRCRQRLGITLLSYRDKIFHVRGIVLSKLNKEAIREQTDANRLVVSRVVTEVFRSLDYPLSTCNMINEACIEACFIDSMFDLLGQEIRSLGPAGRRQA